MEVVVTTAAIRRAKLQSNRHHQQANTQLFNRSDAIPVAKTTVSKLVLTSEDKILFGIVDVQSDKFFEFNMCPSRGQQYKLYKNRSVSLVRAAFFSERVVNVWNSLPDSVDFSTPSKFRRSIMRVDFSKFLRCF